MPHDVAGGRITGIRGWICATSSLGSPVIIVQVRSHSPDSGSFQFSQSPAKVNGRPSFMAIAKRQLRFSRFAPFVKSVRRNQAPSLAECLPERRRFIDGLSSGVDGPISDLRFFDPIWNQSPLQGVERSLLDLRIEANGQHLLTRRNVITDRQISLFWDRNVVEPGEFFFLSCSTIASAHKAGKQITNIRNEKSGWVG
jgi:hypothetical protein